MKNFIILFFALLCFNTVNSQTKILDSLMNELEQATTKTSKLDQYLELGREFYDFDMEIAKKYADTTLQLSLQTENYRLAEIYNLLGTIASDNEKEEEARKYFDKALVQLDIKDDKTLRGIVYGNYSTTYDSSNNFEKELEYNLKAIELNKDIDEEVCFLYYNHAVIYEDAGFHEQALYYLNLAREIANRSKELRVESYSLRSLALFAIDDKKYEVAKTYLDRQLEICNQTNSVEICYHVYFTLGRFYTETAQFEKAKTTLLQAKKLAIQRKLEDDIVANEILLANLEFKRGNYAEAAQIFNTKKIDSYPVENIWFANIAYKNRSIAEEKIGNYEASNTLLKRFVTYSDSIRLSKNRALLAEADRKYETEKKDKEIILKNLQIQQQQARMNYLLGVSLFLLFASFLLWFLHKQRQKRKNQEIITLKREYQIKSLEALIEGEEKERYRIAKELHDGINGDLSTIKYKLSSLLEMNNNVIKEAITMIDDSCKQVRAISHNLVPPSLENFSLIEVTETYCNTMDTVNDVTISFLTIGDEIPLSKKAEINIFRIIQELLTNSLKHAEATEINVQISFQNELLQITVEDDGKGFDKDTITGNGIGLSNIASRIQYLNAVVDFISNKKGTSYTFEIDTKKLNDN